MCRCTTVKRPILFLLRWQRGNVMSLQPLELIFVWRVPQAGSSFVSISAKESYLMTFPLKNVIILTPVASNFACVSVAKWATEYEEPAGDALKFNHPESLMCVNNCSSILRWMISLTWKSLFLCLSICNWPVNWLWRRAVVEERGNVRWLCLYFWGCQIICITGCLDKLILSMGGLHARFDQLLLCFFTLF